MGAKLNHTGVYIMNNRLFNRSEQVIAMNTHTTQPDSFRKIQLNNARVLMIAARDLFDRAIHGQVDRAEVIQFQDILQQPKSIAALNQYHPNLLNSYLNQLTQYANTLDQQAEKAFSVDHR